MESKDNNKLLSAEELLGYLDELNTTGDYILDIEEAREERAAVILSKHKNKK